jgi:1,4-alpha-glucan branching enzyme
MYWSMNIGSQNMTIDRGIALHKMIRLVTLATAGDGYLTFMGNEFGHPEWIDFPREGNDWSFFYARRQWSLVDNPDLRYQGLWCFERAMLQMARQGAMLAAPPTCLRCDEEKKVLLLERAGLIFAFNFNPEHSFDNYGFEVPAGSYALVLDSDAAKFGGFSRNDPGMLHQTVREGEKDTIHLYLPSRTVQVLRKL